MKYFFSWFPGAAVITTLITGTKHQINERIDICKSARGTWRGAKKGGRVHNLPIDFSSADVAQRLVLHARLVPQFPRGESIFARHSSVNEVDRPAPNIGLRSKPARVQRGTITKGNEVERERGGGGTDPSSTRTSRGTSNVYAPLNSSPV